MFTRFSGNARSFFSKSAKQGLSTGIIAIVMSIFALPSISFAAPSTVTTTPATAIGQTTATLNATVNPNGTIATLRFKYGTTTAYGTWVPAVDAGSGNIAVDMSTVINGLTCATQYHYRAEVWRGRNVVNTGLDQTFTTLPCQLPPTVTTGAVTAIGQTTATLNATVNPNGTATTLWFQYGATTAYGMSTSPVIDAGSGNSAVNRNLVITGLTCATLYHYRGVARSVGGVSNGLDQTFTTSACLGTVTTTPATAIGQTTATLNTTVNPLGTSTNLLFQYGTTTAYGTTTSPGIDAGSGNSAVNRNLVITGLTCATLYHYRSVIVSVGGTMVSGLDQTFTTSACPTTPTTVTTGAATAIGSTSATLHATLNPHGTPTNLLFQYGTTTAYGTTTTAVAAGAGTVAVNKNTIVNGLTCGTQYHYRAQARSGGGVSNGLDQTLTTSPCQPSPSISAGGSHTIVLRSDSTVIAWGKNDVGQSTVPATLNGTTAISAGISHNLALKSDGTVVSWGQYSGSLPPASNPVTPSGLGGVIAIAAGGHFSLALKADGTVAAWGVNITGETSVPPSLAGVIAISAGAGHSLALKSNGSVVAWGNNTMGQTLVPASLVGVVGVAAGTSHSVALKSDGTVVAWGDNTAGQSTAPVGLSGVVAIAAGGNHTLALKSDGTVIAWGDNTFATSIIPAQQLSSPSAIATAGDHSVALNADGTVIVWGDTRFGQSNIPAGLNLGPATTQLTLGLNATSFRTGSALTLMRSMAAGIPAVHADIYVGLLLPDGTLLIKQPNGSLSTAITPLQINAVVPTATDIVFSYTFTGTEPVGTYTWLAALMEQGTLNVIGTMASKSFTFTP